MTKLDYTKFLETVSIEDVARKLGMELQGNSSSKYKTLCPFHDDKSPSLIIDTARERGPQHYHCYACNAHGDTIDLVKEKLQINFKEAIEWIAPGTFPISRRKRARDGAPVAVELGKDGLKRGYEIYKRLSNDSMLRAWAAERGLSEAMLHKAGFIASRSNALTQSLYRNKDENNNREMAELLESARLIQNLRFEASTDGHIDLSDGRQRAARYRDFFIGERIVFPIYDADDQLVGLGARRVSDALDAKTPKYQFTQGFPKTHTLYRAEQAFKQLQDASKQGAKNLDLYLCEGFLDALRFESAGLAAVAVMGNSISEKQASLLHNFNRDFPQKEASITINICFDRDEAGLHGAASVYLKLTKAQLDCKFVWPLLPENEAGASAKDPNDYLSGLDHKAARELVRMSSHAGIMAVLADTFGVTAEDTLNQEKWNLAPRSRKIRAFERATAKIKKETGRNVTQLLKEAALATSENSQEALTEWAEFIASNDYERQRQLSTEYLNNADARLNHARILAYMGSQRGELPCDEPGWERLDIAATAFNALLIDHLHKGETQPLRAYDAVWVPRNFGGEVYRQKLMPRPEDLSIQQYLLNELLTERWDHRCTGNIPFSNIIPAVRYYRDSRVTRTTGMRQISDNSKWSEPRKQTLSFAYQIDMDVVEGRQPASDQGMFRPYIECWRDFMSSLAQQARDIGYVYALRLDAKRYYDRLRRYVVRDSILPNLCDALDTLPANCSELFELLPWFKDTLGNIEKKAATITDHLNDHLFGVAYLDPDSGTEKNTDISMGIPQGPVLSAWIGSIAMFRVDEEADKFINQRNMDKTRVGYARYVDDIVLLADSATTLAALRDVVDRRARELELVLIAKADEIPAMSADDFVKYLNEGRALAASGPAWEPPLTGDGEFGWSFFAMNQTTDRQSALLLLHNAELYGSNSSTLIYETVKTAFQATDLRTSELPKAARLIWYAVAIDKCTHQIGETMSIGQLWRDYLDAWSACTKAAFWQLDPEKNKWESPVIFGLEGLERLIDAKPKDISGLSATANAERRKRIAWLTQGAAHPDFGALIHGIEAGPRHQYQERLKLIQWKAAMALGKSVESANSFAERSRPVETWKPFSWLHQAIELLKAPSIGNCNDPLQIFVERSNDLKDRGKLSGFSASIFLALLPSEEEATTPQALNAGTQTEDDRKAETIALQTLVSVSPAERLASYLANRKPLLQLLSDVKPENKLLMPPLPGINSNRIISCTGAKAEPETQFSTSGFESIEVIQRNTSATPLVFAGCGDDYKVALLPLSWQVQGTSASNYSLKRLTSDLADGEYLVMQIAAPCEKISPEILRQAAALFRSLAAIVTSYSQDKSGRELIPAWPYIGRHGTSSTYYLICDDVLAEEIGSRAFVRDGARALRTVEVPREEAALWRVGVAVTDYLGLHDDITKFSGQDNDVSLDAKALADPARYVLRNQLRKLRGTFSNSLISRRRDAKSLLPMTVERSIQLLENYSHVENSPEAQFHYILTTDTETAGMWLALQRGWQRCEISEFLKQLTERVLGRLPLDIGEILTIPGTLESGHRRDFFGILSFSRRLAKTQPTSSVTAQPAWQVLRSAIVCTGIAVAIEGIISTLRSHGAFERYETFDFPHEWALPFGTSNSTSSQESFTESTDNFNQQTTRRTKTLIDQLRNLVQRLGHRLTRNAQSSSDSLSPPTCKMLEKFVSRIAIIEFQNDEDESFDWPFSILSRSIASQFDDQLLEDVATLTKKIDAELGFTVTLACARSFGFIPQTKRFTDSKNGTTEATPWLISQFPRNAKHVEESTSHGQICRIWTEVYEPEHGKLLHVALLGKSFAAIAVHRHDGNTVVSQNDSTELKEISTEQIHANFIAPPNIVQGDSNLSIGLFDSSTSSTVKSEPGTAALAAKPETNTGNKNRDKTNTTTDAGNTANAREIYIRDFRRMQDQEWNNRRHGNDLEPSKIKAGGGEGSHIRIALVQADFHLTYCHPIVETCPTNWPFDAETLFAVTEKIRDCTKYGKLYRANERSGQGHIWDTTTLENNNLHSWHEFKRRRVLKRVIECCEKFGVDLLVLPEYSVRPETITWLKDELPGKHLSVLAGTFMDFRDDPSEKQLSAPLTLLWPLPKKWTNVWHGELSARNSGNDIFMEQLKRGPVLELSRTKKYRSIALEEMFRPNLGALTPLFDPSLIVKEIENQLKQSMPSTVASDLLTNHQLPLKYFFELICSEIFLVSNPANYELITNDYSRMRRRFGQDAIKDEVINDLKIIANRLNIVGDRTGARRSILAVPAATTRSADYWIAGQSTFLASGATTVFCNAMGSAELIGGSCFIGRGSWKTESDACGYISKLTPYHGWSKGIYYNNANDALSKTDEAVVIADIDPHNMLEGKPRAQAMPSPLQLVAYLPLIKTIDWDKTQSSLLHHVGIFDAKIGTWNDKTIIDEKKFWEAVRDAGKNLNDKSLGKIWAMFPDKKTLPDRASACSNNRHMQPSPNSKANDFSGSPAYYDWIDVSLTAEKPEEISKIEVPTWKRE